MATVNADGSLIGLHMTGPFGEVLPTTPQVNGTTTSTPWNTLDRGSFGYVGQHQKLTESALTIQPIQMGARLYIPALGRFLQVDPVQGGTANNYVYAVDSVNEFDLTGEFIPLLLAAIYIGGIAWQAYDTYRDPSPANMVLLGISVAPGVGYIAKSTKIVKAVDRGMVLIKGSKGGFGAGKGFSKGVKAANGGAGKKCAYGCGRQAKETDHIVPKSTGGNNTKKNAQPLCRSCNASKGKNSFPKRMKSSKKIKWFLGF